MRYVEIKAVVSHYWVSQLDGKQWCFFWAGDVPYLACEDDA